MNPAYLDSCCSGLVQSRWQHVGETWPCWNHTETDMKTQSITVVWENCQCWLKSKNLKFLPNVILYHHKYTYVSSTVSARISMKNFRNDVIIKVLYSHSLWINYMCLYQNDEKAPGQWSQSCCLESQQNTSSLGLTPGQFILNLQMGPKCEFLWADFTTQQGWRPPPRNPFSISNGSQGPKA